MSSSTCAAPAADSDPVATVVSACPMAPKPKSVRIPCIQDLTPAQLAEALPSLPAKTVADTEVMTMTVGEYRRIRKMMTRAQEDLIGEAVLRSEAAQEHLALREELEALKAAKPARKVKAAASASGGAGDSDSVSTGGSRKTAQSVLDYMTIDDFQTLYDDYEELTLDIDDRMAKTKNLQALYRWLRGMELPEYAGGTSKSFGTPGAGTLDKIKDTLLQLYAARKAAGWDGKKAGRFALPKD